MFKKALLCGLLLTTTVFSYNSLASNNNTPNDNVNMQTTQSLTAFNYVLNNYDDIAVKIPADDIEKHSIAFLYDNACQYCNKLLMQIPKLTASGVSVYVLPFLNHGAYSESAKSIYLAWSTSNPLSSLIDGDLPSQPNVQTAERIFDFTQDAKTNLHVTQTPYVLLENGNYIDGSFEPNELIQLLNK